MKISLGVTVIILLCAVGLSSAGNVLFLVPFNGPSHWMFLSNFIKELLNRGHHLTAITGLPYRGGAHQNYTEILIDPAYDFDRGRK